MDRRFRRGLGFLEQPFATVGCRWADWRSCFSGGRDVLVLRRNERFGHRGRFLDRALATISRGGAGLNRHLGYWRRLLTSMRTTRQRDLVAPLTLFQHEDRGLWILGRGSLGRRNRLL
ncbi:hypothetical protein EV1_021131 [Malus domestica]